jgi:hypothetical protein
MAKVPDTPENMAKCLCGGCPSYPAAGAVFCAKGKSDSAVTKRGCVCPDCALFNDYSLVDGYYCAAGAAGEGAN